MLINNQMQLFNTALFSRKVLEPLYEQYAASKAPQTAQAFFEFLLRQETVEPPPFFFKPNWQAAEAEKTRKQLLPGARFTGEFFTGDVEVRNIENNDLFVICSKDKSSWPETWNLEHTINGFVLNEYYFLPR